MSRARAADRKDMTTTDEKSAGMPTTGRFGKLRTLAGRVLRRGPVGPEPVQRRAPRPVAPTGECTARWCMAHDHGPRPGLAANGAKPRLAIAHAEPPVPARGPAPLAAAIGTELEMPIGQGVRALLPTTETAAPEVVGSSGDADVDGGTPASHSAADAPADTLAAATTDDRAHATDDRPALIPEVLPPAAHTS